MKNKPVKNSVKKSRLMRSIVPMVIFFTMIIPTLQPIGVQSSMKDISNRNLIMSESAASGSDGGRGEFHVGPNQQYTRIQDAIDATTSIGDVVIVHPFIYIGEGNRDLDFKERAITVRSTAGYEDGTTIGSPGFWSTVINTVIDCQGNETDPHRGFIFHSGENSNSVVQGFTIQNGFVDADRVYLICYEGSEQCFCGGGGAILCDRSGPTIKYNILQNNKVISDNSGEDSHVSIGGAILCIDTMIQDPPIDPIIENNIIDSSQSLRCCSLSGIGGGIGCIRSSPTIKHNTIKDNIAGPDEGKQFNSVVTSGDRASTYWMHSYGGGIYLHASSDPYIESNDIVNNRAVKKSMSGGSHVSKGGGLYSSSDWSSNINYPYDTCRPTFIRNNVAGNGAVVIISYVYKNAFGAQGGGFYGSADMGKDSFSGNTFDGNRAEITVKGDYQLSEADSAEVAGGGMYVEGHIYIDSNTIKNNVATVKNCGAGAMLAYGGGMYVRGIGFYPEKAFVINNTIDGNKAMAGGSIHTAAYGGGITAAGNVVIDRNTIKNNIVDIDQHTSGESSGTPFFIDVDAGETIWIPACGGGIAVTGGGVYIANSVIVGNVARAMNQKMEGSCFKALGGGIAYADVGTGCNADIINCVIVGNEAKTNLAEAAYGGGLGFSYYWSQDHFGVLNSILQNNRADKGLQIALLGGEYSHLVVCIFYSDVPYGGNEIFTRHDAVSWGDGNIDLDPKFVYPGRWDNHGTPDDPADDFFVAGNYHLRWNSDPIKRSPCIDAGSNWIPLPQDSCIQSYLSWFKFDIDGQHRFIDNTSTPDTGNSGDCGYAGIIDMGADEFGCGFIVGDMNYDCQVNFKDINPFVQYLSFFVAWQLKYSDCDPRVGDINGDGVYGQGSFGDINPFVQLLAGG